MDNKHEYKFPSGLINEFEGPLRRKFRSENEVPMWKLVLASLVVLTLSFLVVSKFLEIQEAHAQSQIQAVESHWVDFCAQAMADHQATGTAASEDLNKLCK